MKHVQLVTRRPAAASTDIGIGQIIAIIAQILGVIGEALTDKGS